MTAATLKAHYDGESIQLDEPCELEKGAQLIVTVVTPEVAAEREAWFNLVAQTFAQGYGPDEPDYSLDDVIKE